MTIEELAIEMRERFGSDDRWEWLEHLLDEAREVDQDEAIEWEDANVGVMHCLLSGRDPFEFYSNPREVVERAVLEVAAIREGEAAK